MKYQIDQSGKIEQTNKITVIAFSNHKSGSISLASKDKKILQEIYRNANKPKMFAIQVFATLVFLLIRKYKLDSQTITIDKEYPGYENLIKSYIFQLIRKSIITNSNNLVISFQTIGKSSGAHEVANKCFKKGKTDFKTDYKEVLGLI